MARHGLAIRTGYAKDSAVFKLSKPQWSSDEPATLINRNGIFFSIWIDFSRPEPLALRYNIHALKLRTLPGYRIASRGFAEAFRTQAAPLLAGWPNVSTDFGPLTLCEGFMDFNESSLDTDARYLAHLFPPAASIIDTLLLQRRSGAVR